MGFLRMLNDFFHVKDYEARIREREKYTLDKLRYVEELLLDEATKDLIPPRRQAEINAYVAKIKHDKEIALSFRTYMKK